MRAFACACLLAALAAAPAVAFAAGAPVTGRVVNNAGQPVAGALVDLVELHRATTTDHDGAFRFGDIPAGRYTITARHIGLIPAAKAIVVESSPVNVSLMLDERATRIEPVNVTALRSPVADADSPLPTSVLTGDQVHAEGGVSLAHSIASLPGVRNVSTGEQIGKPMIRGLFGPRILVLADGSRLEDYSWSDEDGPSLDARIADRIEVIRGPASVLYGSDALSGVVNVIPSELSYSPDGSKQRRAAIEAYGGSNSIELGGALMAEGAQSNYAWRIIGTGRFSQNYQTPTGEEPNSSFWALNGEGSFGIRGDNTNTTFRVAHYGGEFHLLEFSGPEAGDPEGGPVRQTLDDRIQVTNDYVTHGLRFETKAQFQRHSLAEVSDDCVPVPPATTCQKVKDRQAFGLVLNTGLVDAMMHHGGGEGLSGTLGVSGMYQSSTSSGPIFLVPSATINSVAAFALEQFKTGPVAFLAGGRVDSRNLSSDAQPEISRAADSESWTAASGDVGVVVHLTPQLSALANAATGWRSPTLFDLYANGPNLAEARFEVGDPTMNTERSKSIDGGLRWASDRARAEVSVFRSDIANFIFTTPTSQTRNGLQVFQHTQADARLQGAELSLEARVADQVVLRASHDLVQGDDKAANVPLPLMPPQRTILGAEFDWPRAGPLQKLQLGGDVEVNQKQTRLNPEDLATDGYTLLNLDASFEHSIHGAPGRFDIRVRNALNTTYRDFLSRFKGFADGPGINVIFKVSAGTW
jgi:iron complex outermembrane receptor protein